MDTANTALANGMSANTTLQVQQADANAATIAAAKALADKNTAQAIQAALELEVKLTSFFVFSVALSAISEQSPQASVLRVRLKIL